MGVAVQDPVDAHLLALVAEVGRVAVHDLAKRAGMDVREVAARLAGLAAGGLPLVVGVECDPTALRYAIAGYGWPQGAAGGPSQVNQPSGPYGVVQTGPPSGPLPAPGYRWPGQVGYQGDQGRGPSHSGPHGGFGPTGAGHGATDQRAPGRAAVDPVDQRTPGRAAPPPADQRAPGGAAVDPVGTWGPPGSASWARGDQLLTTTVRTTPARRAATGDKRAGAIGDTLHADGPDGVRLAIHLVEVVDPADFLFTAAGYRLQPGERSVVVHTEVTNHGGTPYPSLPDLYLVLLDGEGNAVSKAPVSLSSRPPHRIGVKPGETAGGHTVYVLPESTELAAVRWSARPDDEQHALSWSLRGT